MQKLFNDITSIIERNKQEKEIQLKNGDSFNLFQSLCLSTDELIHSKMIAEILDPRGLHGKGSIFLKKFLSLYDFGFSIDTESASVVTEFDIGPISKNYSYGGKIDILITDAHKHALIIENKIYAGDQKKQLFRYANYAMLKQYDFAIIYLTLDCHDPSVFSTGKKPNYNYVMFSYEEDILPWLDECMKECTKGSVLYDSLFQYSQCIRKVLNLMNVENEEAILGIATDSKNINSVLALFNIEQKIKKRIIDSFIKNLCCKANELGFVTEIDDDFDEKSETYISFNIPKQSKKWALFIGSRKNNAKAVYYSIDLFEDESSRIKKADFANIPHLWNVFKQDKNNPCGWSYFWSESGEKYSGKWYNWYDNETLEAMVDGRLMEFIVKKIFTPIIETDIFDILNKC